ncbi:hypothetical protein [Denitratisoma oestradiolicum]|nr:hypothetical protein [Denitratisoma oestradiolicum]TWO79230.1 hypothetical protein CBW56_15690 [Denitratisoma oestradiolicum]
MSRPAHLALPLLAAFLAACSPVTLRGSGNQYWLKSSSAVILTTTDSLIAYHAYVRSLSGAEWNRESEQVREAVQKDGSEFQRLRLAMVMAVPLTGPREHARAMQQLEQLERETQKQNSSLHGLIAALKAELAERRRLEDALRDESRRADDLEQKLDALKAIERNLLERSQPPPPPVSKKRR